MKFAIQNICIVNSSCAHPPGQYWGIFPHWPLPLLSSRVGKAVHCFARTSFFSSPNDWSRKFWGVNIIPLTNVAYGYKSLINNRTLNLLNRKKGLSLIKSLHILWPRELFEFKRIYIQLSISHQYFEILRPVPNWYTAICPQTYYQLFQEVNSFPRASGNRCNTWLPQTTRFKIS